MPPKSKEAIKAETRDKVREIRMRQESWMKQRNMSLERAKSAHDRDVSPHKGTHHKKHTCECFSCGKKNQTPSHSVSLTRSDGSQGQKSGLAAARNSVKLIHPQSSRKDPAKQDDAISVHSSLESTDLGGYETPCIVPGEKRSPNKSASPSKSSNTNAAGSPNSMPPHLFNALADEIINRVRQELHISPPPTTAHENIQTDNYEEPIAINKQPGGALAENKKREDSNLIHRHMSGQTEKTEYHDVQTHRHMSGQAERVMEHWDSKQKSLTALSKRPKTHCCHVCGELMTGEENTPMIAIPCGHTFCKFCIQTQNQFCPDCECEVTSYGRNTMLEHIIDHFKSSYMMDMVGTDESHHHVSESNQAKRISLEEKKSIYENRILSQEEKRQWQDGRRMTTNEKEASGDKQMSRVEKQTTHKDMQAEEKNYKEEYQNLAIRFETLEEEQSNIITQIEHYKEEIDREVLQLSHLGKAEEAVHDEIKKLEKRIADLQGHRKEFEDTTKQLQNHIGDEEKRLKLVRESMKHIQGEMFKLKERTEKLSTQI